MDLEYLQSLHRNHEEWFEGSMRAAKSDDDVPNEIRDCVLHLNAPTTHSAIRNLPILVLDYDVEIDFETEEASEHREYLTKQVKSFYSYVKDFHVKREGGGFSSDVDNDNVLLKGGENEPSSYYPPILNWDSKETKVMMSVFASEAKRRGYDTDGVIRR